MNTTVKYDIELIKEEALQLVKKRLVNRQQPIYTLCKYIPHRDWVNFDFGEVSIRGSLGSNFSVEFLGCFDSTLNLSKKFAKIVKNQDINACWKLDMSVRYSSVL